MKKNAWAILWIALVIIITFTTNMWAKGSPMFNSTPVPTAVAQTVTGTAAQAITPAAQALSLPDDEFVMLVGRNITVMNDDQFKKWADRKVIARVDTIAAAAGTSPTAKSLAASKIKSLMIKAASAAKSLSGTADALSGTAKSWWASEKIDTTIARLKIGFSMNYKNLYANPTLDKGWVIDNTQDTLSTLIDPTFEYEKYIVGVKISPMPRKTTSDYSFYGAPMGSITYWTVDLVGFQLHSPVSLAGARPYIEGIVQYNWKEGGKVSQGGYAYKDSLNPCTIKFGAGLDIEAHENWVFGLSASIADPELNVVVPPPGTTVKQGPVIVIGANFKWQSIFSSSHK